MAVTPDDPVDWVAAIVSHATRSEQRWALVRLAGSKGSFKHNEAKTALGATSSGGVTTHLDPLVDAHILEKHAGGYRLTPWGSFVYALLRQGALGAPAAELVGKRLLATSRPKAINPATLLDVLKPAARAVMRTDGRYRYVAVYDNEPDLVEDLLFAIQELGADGIVLYVSDMD